MSYCNTCIHHDVCGVEGVDDEGMTYCVDRLEPCKDTISRQAAIQAIYNNINRLNMAKAVHDLPSVQPIPCNYAISRTEVHDLLATWLSDKLDEKTREVLEVIDGKVENMSSVTPKQTSMSEEISREEIAALLARGSKDKLMTIYVDNGEEVKIYPVKVKVAKAVMTLLETDDELVWSETHKGYGVEIVDKTEGVENNENP